MYLVESFVSNTPLFAAFSIPMPPKKSIGTSSASCITAATGFLKAEYSFFSLGSLLDNIITAGTTAALPKKSNAILAPSPIPSIFAKEFATFF